MSYIVLGSGQLKVNPHVYFTSLCVLLNMTLKPKYLALLPNKLKKTNNLTLNPDLQNPRSPHQQQGWTVCGCRVDVMLEYTRCMNSTCTVTLQMGSSVALGMSQNGVHIDFY